MRWTIVAVLVVTACEDSKATQPAPAPEKTADDCKLFLTKARGTMEKLATAAGVTWSPAMEETALSECRADVAAGKRAHLIDCVLSAKDEPAVQACFPRFEELTDAKLAPAAR
ncbi:MAG: hypothetical protein SFX73_01375 [Kofleriaceae bacterium]|nr:hypothetical protein [Kofleriaceae bacterium]